MSKKNYTPPIEDCPECTELTSTVCIIEEDSLPGIGIGTGSTLKSILAKISTTLYNMYLNTRNSYKTSPVITGEKWIDGSTVKKVVVEFDNTGGTITNPISVNVSGFSINRIIESSIISLDTVNNTQNGHLLSFNKGTENITVNVEASSKAYGVFKFI